jgi:hypothetical protein
MGLSPGWLDLFCDLVRAGELKPGDAILDFGASELFCSDDPQSLNRVLSACGAPLYSDDELERLAQRAYARILFERAGFRYEAIDYAAYPGVIRLDLNTASLPSEHHGKYRLVSNSGTSEHILNQWNVFQAIHEAAAPGALMYHSVPGWGHFEHGIIEYSPKFFRALADANGYEIERFSAWSDGTSEVLDVRRLPWVKFSTSPIVEKVWLHILLRKSSDRPFAGLNDPAHNREWRIPQSRLRFEARSPATRIVRRLLLNSLLAVRRFGERVQALTHR